MARKVLSMMTEFDSFEQYTKLGIWLDAHSKELEDLGVVKILGWPYVEDPTQEDLEQEVGTGALQAGFWLAEGQIRYGKDLDEDGSPADESPENELAYFAWTVIANAYGGNWDVAPAEWREAAERWRDECFHPSIRLNHRLVHIG